MRCNNNKIFFKKKLALGEKYAMNKKVSVPRCKPPNRPDFLLVPEKEKKTRRVTITIIVGINLEEKGVTHLQAHSRFRSSPEFNKAT